MLIEEATRFIREDLVTAEFAFHEASEKYAEALSKVDDAYLSERAADIRDVAQRVLADLMGQAPLHRPDRPDRAVRGGGPRPDAVRHGDDGSGDGAGVRHRGWQPHVTHSHPCAFSAHPGGARAGTRRSASYTPASRCCSTASTASSSLIRRSRRSSSTANWSTGRPRSRRASRSSTTTRPRRGTATGSSSQPTSSARPMSRASSSAARPASACFAPSFCSSTAATCRARRNSSRPTAR